MPFTDMQIRALPTPAQGAKVHLDDSITGFGIRVSQGGTKTFVLTYGSERRRITLGRYPLLTLSQARQKAKEQLAKITLGEDHARMPLQALKDSFLVEKKRTTRLRTYQGYKWLLERISLPSDATKITARVLSDACDNLEPSVREHTIAAYKILFRFAVSKGYLKQNPLDSLTVRKSKARKRVLSDDELKKVWNACPENGFGNTVRLLILTGQRKSEIAPIAVKGDLATVPPEYVKNHRTHVFPIGKYTAELFNKPRDWGGWSKSKTELDKASGVTDWTLHDLRRTFRTKWAALRLPREVAEKYINHVSGVQDPVEQIYDQHDYLEEMRDAIKVFTDHMTVLLQS